MNQHEYTFFAVSAVLVISLFIAGEVLKATLPAKVKAVLVIVAMLLIAAVTAPVVLAVLLGVE